MEVDATCIVQMGHFIIAYYMLKRFLLKPLVEKVHAQDNMMRALQQEVDARKVLVKQQEQDVHDQWRAYQNEFAATMPTVSLFPEVMPPPIFSTSDKNVLNAEEKTIIIETLKQEIIARVERVD